MNAHNGMGGFLNLSLLRKCCLDQIPTIQVNYYSAPQKVKGKLSVCDFFFPSAFCQKVVTCGSHYHFAVITRHSISCPKLSFCPVRWAAFIKDTSLFPLSLLLLKHNDSYDNNNNSNNSKTTS